MIVMTRQELKQVQTEIKSMFFLFNSLLDMDNKTEKLTKYVEEKVNVQEEDTPTEGAEGTGKGEPNFKD